MSKHARALLVALLAALIAFAFSACGGGGGDESVDSLLKDTFSGNQSVKSGRLNLSFTLNAQGVQTLRGPVSLALQGPFESQGDKKLPKFDLTLSASAQGRSLSAGATSTGDQGFIKLQSTSYSVPADVFQRFKTLAENQANQPNRGGQFSLSSLGIQPRDWLQNPKKAGEDDVGGAKTVHVTAGVDVAALLDDVNKLLGRAGSLGAVPRGQVPRSLTPQQRQQIAQAVKNATVDVYTGKDDKILRKLVIKFAFDVPAAQRSQSGGLRSGDIGLTVEVDDVNKTQDIKAPANPKPFRDLSAAVKGLGNLNLGGGSSGGSGGSSGGSGGTTPGTGANSQAYLRCVQQARGDVRKAQRCARFLSP